MEPKEKACFDHQLEAKHQKLIAISRVQLELQALPIGLPDPVLMRQYRKKKTHGLADACGLTGADITALELKNCEALAQKGDVATPEDSEEDDGLLLFSTPRGWFDIACAVLAGEPRRLEITPRSGALRVSRGDPWSDLITCDSPRRAESAGATWLPWPS